VVPMVKESGQQGSDKWKSILDTSSQATSFHILLKPEDTAEYATSHPEVIKEGVFYVPLAQNQVAFDSFLLVGQVLYLFQMTIAARHEIKEGIMDFLKHPTLMRAQWYFIFVTPTASPLVCRQPNVAKMDELWQKAKLFVAEIDFHTLWPPQDDDSADVISNEANQPTASRPSRISTTIATLKRKAGGASLSSTEAEASSSKARLPGNRKVAKGGE